MTATLVSSHYVALIATIMVLLSGGGFGHIYSAAGRMSEFSVNGVLQASYTYDFAGRQANRVLSGVVTIHSVFDAAGNRIAEYNEATGALLRE